MSTETKTANTAAEQSKMPLKKIHDFFNNFYRKSSLALKLFYHMRLPHMIFYRMEQGPSPEKTFEKYQPYLQYPESEKKAIIKDMTREFWLHGVHFDEFLYYDFYKKDRKYRNSFVTGTYKVIHVGKVNQSSGMLLFNNKFAFAQKYAKYFRRDFLELKSAEDYDAFCTFIKKHPSFIKKPILGSKGQDIEIIKTDETTDLKELFDRLIANNAKVLIEELVRQDPEMKKLNESSVNTIRMITVLTGSGPEDYEVHVFHPCVRIGRAGSVIDNADTGGILVKIGDLKTGKLYPVGKDRNAVAYTHHPDTGLCFADFVIPKWDELLKMTDEVARITPENRFVGWDYALSEDGWVLIEGNAALNFSGPQICDLVGKRPELEALLKQIK